MEQFATFLIALGYVVVIYSCGRLTTRPVFAYGKSPHLRWLFVAIGVWIAGSGATPFLLSSPGWQNVVFFFGIPAYIVGMMWHIFRRSTRVIRQLPKLPD